jgi:putative N-acetylmannosaminyltransferase
MKEYLKQVYNKSEKEYFKLLSKWLKNNEKKFIITANPETLTMAETDEEISKMLLDKNNSIVPDGIAVVKACNMLNLPVTERIAGVDIAEYLLRIANEQKKSLYLFGAKKEVIESLVNKIKVDYNNINILGYSDGYVEDRDKVFKEIIKLKPDICLVALGIPYQEKLIYKHLDEFNKGIFVGVGGSFDVLSGTKKRAPKIFIKLNLEWLYRIVCEPKRLKRFWNNNVKFILKIRKEK